MAGNALKQIKNCSGQVERILEQYPETRDDDILLYHKFLVCYGDGVDSLFFNGGDLLKSMRSIPTPESIRRSRQKIQEEGRFMGTKRLKRMRESSAVAAWARSE